MSVLLTRLHSILNLGYSQKAFSENCLRILESSGRLCGVGVQLGVEMHLHFSVVLLKEKVRISAPVTLPADCWPTTTVLSSVWAEVA